MKVYFISGLAADKRVFKHIKLPEGYEIVHLDWIESLDNDTLASYALRLGSSIDTSVPFGIVGLSMGGMMASEIARKHHPAFTVLISSVPCNAHLPKYFKIFRTLRLHRMVPVAILKQASIVKRMFTSESSGDKKIVCDVIRDSDPRFIKWAMHAVLTWSCEQLSHPYIHVHGTRDEILPVRYTKPTHLVKGAGHLMIMTRASEVNRILQEVCRRR
ncbi:MAG: alpha/beta hydrolase [Chitinophagaceae bacterium]|nr:alpha/beta hydrolase [Chitinophagaceae bacterium]